MNDIQTNITNNFVLTNLLTIIKKKIKNIFKSKTLGDNLLWILIGFISSGLICYLLFKIITLVEIVNTMQIEHNSLICRVEQAKSQLEALKNSTTLLSENMEIVNRGLFVKNDILKSLAIELMVKRFTVHVGGPVFIGIFYIALINIR